MFVWNQKIIIWKPLNHIIIVMALPIYTVRNYRKNYSFCTYFFRINYLVGQTMMEEKFAK